MTFTHFETESGAHYEIDVEYGMNGRVRRLPSGDSPEKRADGVWLELKKPVAVFPNYPVTLVIESLAPYGPDDDGSVPAGSSETIRTTSPVTEVWTEEIAR